MAAGDGAARHLSKRTLDTSWCRARLRVAELAVAAPTPRPDAAFGRHARRVVKAARQVDDALATGQSRELTWRRRLLDIVAEAELAEGAATPHVNLAVRGQRAAVARAERHF